MPSEGMIGQVALYAFGFEPTNWKQCDGRLLDINSNSALFSVLGTTYGGNGTSTFGLPDLRDAAPVSQGTGPGLAPRDLGSSSAAVGAKSGADATLPATQVMNWCICVSGSYPSRS